MKNKKKQMHLQHNVEQFKMNQQQINYLIQQEVIKLKTAKKSHKLLKLHRQLELSKLLKENKDVASNTRKLFEEAPITSSKYDKVPNLITKNHKSFNKDEEITKINKLTMMLNLKRSYYSPTSTISIKFKSKIKT